MDEIDAKLLAEIYERRRDSTVANRQDILSLLTLARFEDGSAMDDRELRDQLMTLLVAGHETTATALAWTLDLLLRNPPALARLTAKVDEGKDDDYLRALIQESLRLRPVVPLAGRRLVSELRVDGLVLPADTRVTPAIWLTHTRSDVCPEPLAFRPERFLGHQPSTYAWIPFGGGVRRCLGAAFAEMEMRVGCWTRAPTCARPGRCTGSSPPATAASESDATSSPTPPTTSPSCSPPGRMRCGPWDMSKLKGPAKWTWFYLYVILDVFSCYAVGWTVQYRENAQLAKALIEQAACQQQITPKVLTLHAGRGAPQRAKPVAFLLADLAITKTYSRPYTSSDDPYSESNFKTLKYRPEFPERFDDIEHARAHCRQFFRWYNHEHRHSGIGLMTPAAIHHGQAPALHTARGRVLDAAYERHPERFVHKPPSTSPSFPRPLDQQARHQGGRSLNPAAKRLTGLDRLRTPFLSDRQARAPCGCGKTRSASSVSASRSPASTPPYSTAGHCRSSCSGTRSGRWASDGFVIGEVLRSQPEFPWRRITRRDE